MNALCNALPENFSPTIKMYEDAVGKHYMITTSAFDGCLDAACVRVIAAPLLRDLAGAWATFSRHTLSIASGGVSKFDEDGVLIERFTSAEGHAELSVATATAVGVVLDQDGNPLPPSPPQPSPVQAMVELAQQHQEVRTLLKAAGQADSWFEIYKVFDSAKDVAPLIGQKSLKDLLGAEWQKTDYMAWSSQFDRHAKPTKPCPVGFGPDQMGLSEARQHALWLAAFMIQSLKDTVSGGS